MNRRALAKGVAWTAPAIMVAAAAPSLSRGQVKKIARKLAHRAERMQTVEEFEHALKILGVYPDPTARDAIA